MKAIILAAGQGKRMHSDLQKVMHPMLGKPIIQYVVEAALDAGAEDITVVVGRGGDDIKNGLARFKNLNFAVQDPPLGTGHAAQAGIGRIKDSDDVLILYGDMPLVTVEFLTELKNFYRAGSSEAVVSAVYRPDARDFGRVYDKNGDFIEIVEFKDMKPDSPPTDWVNPGIYLFKGEALKTGLSRMTNNNSQLEYYLTDVPKLLKDDGRVVKVFHTREDISAFTGINTHAQLAEATAHMRGRVNELHMAAGVRMLDPASAFIDSDTKIAPGAVLYPGCILEGKCEIESGAVIGPNTHMKDTVVGANARVRQSVTDNAKIGEGTEVGPFAYLRPGTVIGKNCRVGNFVEVKNSNLGDGTKMAHLAYIGDADVGSGVNYGCGAITVNYDGAKKHRTTINDGAFVGSNVNLIAPVEIGLGAFVAAGSTITDCVQADALGIARQRQTNKPGWRKRK
ncbi:MAG: bifunctional UDP-N-acetylglucosamine diphosphorylase/glucosamine-1-phosphate N-acetyltransferase GlmU [Defluviitaleaceae bacterium]|nr:bifunctional UDP-N-acetylglucosamine diphosphorylase/glucosamine-1-phosphate N-acetyltransferase GlmU [Defluviitaleaceae bacterium]